MDESQKWTVACLRNKVIDLEATEEHRECASDLQEALDLIEQQAARIAELERQLKDAAMSTHRQAICIQQCAAAIGPETSATINGLPNAVKALAEHNAALEAQIAAAEKQEPIYQTGWPTPETVWGDVPKDAYDSYTDFGYTRRRILYTHPLPPDADGWRKDALRYRWLRAQHWDESTLFVVAAHHSAVRLGTDCPSDERLDEAVDAALTKQQDQT